MKTLSMLHGCRTVFGVTDSVHEGAVEAGEQAVLEGTSKWECKVQTTGRRDGGVKKRSLFSL